MAQAVQRNRQSRQTPGVHYRSVDLGIMFLTMAVAHVRSHRMNREGHVPQTSEIVKTFGERCPQVMWCGKQELFLCPDDSVPPGRYTPLRPYATNSSEKDQPQRAFLFYRGMLS